MPFEVLETETKHNRPPTALVSYMRPKPRVSKKSAGGAKDYDRTKVRPSFQVTIPTTICGTAKEDKFQLLLGTGSDRGKVRVKGSKDKKAVKATQFKHAMTWRFGFVPRLGDEIFDDARCPVRKIGDNEFEIDIPETWFIADSPSKPASLAKGTKAA